MLETFIFVQLICPILASPIEPLNDVLDYVLKRLGITHKVKSMESLCHYRIVKFKS